MGDWASCGFRNVNDLLGIFRHFYRGLKVPIPLYQCDEGEERLRWAIFGRRWRHAAQFSNGCYESEPLNTLPDRQGRALCKKMHRPQGSLCWSLHLAGVREKDMTSPKDSMGYLFAVSNVLFGLSGLIYPS